MKTMKQMLQKMHVMRNGLLKFTEDDSRISLPVESVRVGEDGYDWELAEDPEKSLVNKQVILIQKQDDDYIYLTGFVSRQKTRLKTVVTVQVLRICWMVKRMNGNISWLEENFIYENLREPLRAA